MLAELASSTGALERATRDLTRMRRDLVARHFTALPGRASRAMFAAFATRIAEQEGCAGDLRELEAAVQVAQDARASYAALDAELTAKDRQWEMYEPAMLRRLKANTRRLRRVPESLDAEIEP